MITAMHNLLRSVVGERFPGAPPSDVIELPYKTGEPEASAPGGESRATFSEG
jgi:hypothetical protein